MTEDRARLARLVTWAGAFDGTSIRSNGSKAVITKSFAPTTTGPSANSEQASHCIPITAGALSSLLNSVGISVTQRIIGSAASRWVPVVGAVVVGGYAYWDTMQVAKTARSLLAKLDSITPG